MRLPEQHAVHNLVEEGPKVDLGSGPVLLDDSEEADHSRTDEKNCKNRGVETVTDRKLSRAFSRNGPRAQDDEG